MTGPTATGKTALAIELACARGDIEIINADSLLVYRHFNVGTAKPTLEERKGIPHHLIDVQSPDTSFTAGDFVRSAHQAIEDIHARGKRALIVGGTGFYLKGLLFGVWDAPSADPEIRATLSSLPLTELHARLLEIDPASAQRIGPHDHYRLVRALEIFQISGKTPSQLEQESEKCADPRFHLWILDRPQAELSQRIHQRTRQMLESGLVQEVSTLMAQYPSSRALDAVGYRQVRDHLLGILPEGRALRPGIAGLSEEIELATRQLVKKQRTWFRNQAQKVSQSRLFILDQDLSLIREEFQRIYSSSPHKKESL